MLAAPCSLGDSGSGCCDDLQLPASVEPSPSGTVRAGVDVREPVGRRKAPHVLRSEAEDTGGPRCVDQVLRDLAALAVLALVTPLASFCSSRGELLHLDAVDQAPADTTQPAGAPQISSLAAGQRWG